MIRFEANKLSVTKTLMTKITDNFIYVVDPDFDGVVDEIGTHMGDTVYKIRISPAVATAYQRNNRVREFYEPCPVALLYYGDDIIVIEPQRASIHQETPTITDWVPRMSEVVPVIRAHTADKDAFINGDEILWPVHTDDDGFSSHRVAISDDGCLWMQKAGGIRLGDLDGRVGKGKYKATYENVGNKSHVSILSGQVIAYSPNPDAGDEAIVVYSPLLRRRTASGDQYDTNNPRRRGGGRRRGRGPRGEASREASESTGLDAALGGSGGDGDEIRTAWRLNNADDPAFANLDFILYAGTMIGRLYGQKDNDFLDIPRIVAQTGEVNFARINPDSRALTAVNHLSAVDAIVWLLGYIHRETDLDRMRDLTKAFRHCMSRGIVRTSATQVKLRHGKSMSDLPMKRYKGGASRIEHAQKTLQAHGGSLLINEFLRRNSSFGAEGRTSVRGPVRMGSEEIAALREDY